tara:strand:- start:1310 stop:1756 length:447 start_codon:yes stop_codon:yes gene_type:complete
MFLSKKAMRPVGLGSFCTIPDDLKNEMKQQQNYTVNNGATWNQKFLHLADADLLYVVDNKVFDNEDLFRVLPISFTEDGYWAEKAYNAAQKKISFTVHKSKLALELNGWKERESIKAVQENRLRNTMDTYNYNYELERKNIPLRWEDS